MNFEILFSFLAASMVLTLMPGPDIIFVFTESITKSAKHGVGIALGLVTGLLFHTMFAALGLSIVVQQSETLFTIIKSLGAIYLLYLAYESYREKPKTNKNGFSNNLTEFSLKRLFFKGILMNISNPKVSLFFIAFFPKFLFSAQLEKPLQFLVLGIIFIIQAFLIFSTVSICASKITFLKPSANNNRKPMIFKVSIYVLLAIYILV